MKQDTPYYGSIDENGNPPRYFVKESHPFFEGNFRARVNEIHSNRVVLLSFSDGSKQLREWSLVENQCMEDFQCSRRNLFCYHRIINCELTDESGSNAIFLVSFPQSPNHDRFYKYISLRQICRIDPWDAYVFCLANNIHIPILANFGECSSNWNHSPSVDKLNDGCFSLLGVVPYPPEPRKRDNPTSVSAKEKLLQDQEAFEGSQGRIQSTLELCQDMISSFVISVLTPNVPSEVTELLSQIEISKEEELPFVVNYVKKLHKRRQQLGDNGYSQNRIHLTDSNLHQNIFFNRTNLDDLLKDRFGCRESNLDDKLYAFATVTDEGNTKFTLPHGSSIDVDCLSIYALFDKTHEAYTTHLYVTLFLLRNLYGSCAKSRFCFREQLPSDGRMWSCKQVNDSLPNEMQKKEIIIIDSPMTIAIDKDSALRFCQSMITLGYPVELNPMCDHLYKQPVYAVKNNYIHNPPPFSTVISALEKTCPGFIHFAWSGMRFNIFDAHTQTLFEGVAIAQQHFNVPIYFAKVDVAITTKCTRSELPQWTRKKYHIQGNKPPKEDLFCNRKGKITSYSLWVDDETIPHATFKRKESRGTFQIKQSANKQSVHYCGIGEVKCYVDCAHLVREYKGKLVDPNKPMFFNTLDNKNCIRVRDIKRTLHAASNILLHNEQIINQRGFCHR